MTYVFIKNLHMLAALTTISGFILRGIWMMTRSDKLQHRAVRIAPHVVDTVFLLSGIAMIALLSLNPFTQSWLVAKFIGLIIYILLGTIAIKRGPTLEIRIVAFVAALSTFAYIAGVAIFKSPVSWLAFLP